MYNFNFAFGVGPDCYPVKVLLTHVYEQSALGNTESLLIHIRPEANSRVAA